jgi:hypothetical protein
LEPGTKPGHSAERILAARLARLASRAGLRFADRVFGLAWSGAMTAGRLAGLIAAMPDGTTEIFTHPATADHFPGSAPGYRYRDELAGLIDPGVIEIARSIAPRDARIA